MKTRQRKFCAGDCNEQKPLEDFYRNKNRPDGRQPRCKVCMRIAYKASRDKKLDHYRSVARRRYQRGVDS